MTDTTIAPVNESLDRIGVLAGQITSATSFASASIAYEILQHARQVQTVARQPCLHRPRSST